MSDHNIEPSCHPLDTDESKVSGSVEEVKVSELKSQGSSAPLRRAPRTIPPFIPAHDIPRGALYAFQALLTYALMLAVMCELLHLCHLIVSC